MIKQMLAVDGVRAVCRFRDDGAFVEGYGMLPENELVKLAHFAHEYKRIVQANADQLSMFTGIGGWTPPGGWMVRGSVVTVCSVANLVCTVKSDEGDLSEVMQYLLETSQY